MKEHPKIRVFISYSRKESGFAERLRQCLEEDGFEAYMDVEDIVKGEPWRDRLTQLIESADAIAFLLSPHSVASRVCEWEIGQAEALSKRIFPIVCKPTDRAAIPDRLNRLNHTNLSSEDRWPEEYERLRQSLQEDARLVREHTRIGELARRWEVASRRKDLLLLGKEITLAERWRDEVAGTSVHPSRLHLEFIAASRNAAAQWQRTKLKLWFAAFVIAAGLGLYANSQRILAIQQRDQALINQALTQWKTGVLYRDRLGLAGIAAQWFARASASPDAALADSARLAARQAVRGVGLIDITNIENSNAPGHSIADCASNPYGIDLGEECVGYTTDPSETWAASWYFDGLVKVWELESGTGSGCEPANETRSGREIRHTFVTGARLSPPSGSSHSGLSIVTWGDDATVRIWDVCNGEETSRFHHDDLVKGAMMEPGDGRLLSWSADRTVRLWRPGESSPAWVGHHDGEVLGARFIAGNIVMSWGWDNAIRFWDGDTGIPLLSELHHDSEIETVEYLEEQARILSRTRRLQYEWQINADNAEIATLAPVYSRLSHGDRAIVNGGAFDPSGTRLLTYDSSNHIRVWNQQAQRGHSQFEATVPGGWSRPVSGAVFTGDGQQWVAWSNRSVGVFESGSGENCAFGGWNIKTMPGTVRVTEDSRLLLGANPDGTLWSCELPACAAATGAIAPELECHASEQAYKPFTGALFDSEGARLLSWSGNGIAINERGDGVVADFIPIPGFDERNVRQALFSPDAKEVLIGGTGGHVTFCDVSEYPAISCLRPRQYGTEIYDLKFSPDGRLVSGITATGEVLLIDVSTLDLVRQFAHLPVGSSPKADGQLGVWFDPSGHRILSWSNDGEIRLWDIATGDQVTSGLLHGRGLQGILLSPSAQSLLSWGAAGGGARLWNLGYLPGEGSADLQRQLQLQTGLRLSQAEEAEVILPAEWQALRAASPQASDPGKSP